MATQSPAASKENKVVEFAVQITAPYFCAGIVIRNGVVTKAAPILKQFKGYTYAQLVRVCTSKGWRCSLTKQGGTK